MLASGLGCRTKNRGASERASMSGLRREPGSYSRRARCVGKRRGGADVAKRWFPLSTVPGMVAALPTTGTASDALDVPTKRAPCEWEVAERTALRPCPLPSSDRVCAAVLTPPDARGRGTHPRRTPIHGSPPGAVTCPHTRCSSASPAHSPARNSFSHRSQSPTLPEWPRNAHPRRARVRVGAQPAVPDIPC